MSFSSENTLGHCPTVYDCDSIYQNNQSWSSFSVGPAPCYVGIVSDFMSCISSLAIILIYLIWKDIRESTSQAIVTFIAISDFFTASSFMTGSVNLLSYPFSGSSLESQDCTTFETICTIESYVVTCATMSSYLWTMILGVHLFLIMVWRKLEMANKLLPLYHLIAWGLPTVIAFPLLIMNRLLYAPFITGVWCYIELNHDTSAYNELIFDPTKATLLKLPEVLAFLLMILLFTITRVYITKQATIVTQESGLLPNEQEKAKCRISKLERTLMFIPIAFVLLRMWAVVQFFYSVYLQKVATGLNSSCIPSVPHKQIYVTLGILQAIGGGGQGWMNAILYIFLSAKLRKRILMAFKNNLMKCFVRKRSDIQVTQGQSSITGTHFSPSLEPVSTDHLIRNWEIMH